MNIEWNKVTWYSWLVALIVFVGAFGIGIWLGMQIADARMAAQMGGMNMQGMSGMPGMSGSVASSSASTGGTSSTAGNGVIANVSYSCENGKKVQAVYKQGQVQVTTNDGTSLTLPQTMSADGGRYANADESFVFWSKGNGAFIEQTVNGVSTTTYANCTQISSSAQ